MILLVDADILLHRFAYRNEAVIQWGENVVSELTNPAKAFTEVKNFIQGITEKTNCEEAVLCFSHELRFRYKLMPSYKHNRANKEKPKLWATIKEHLQANYTWKEKPWLEADDVLGVLATRYPNRYIIASIDKDLKTIPCKLFNWDKDDKPKTITKAEADYWFYYQVLVGDVTDGYLGCPGIGPKKAEKLLKDCSNYWQTIVETYEAKGLTTEDALQQARMARILRAEDYDFKNKEVILWVPD